MATKKSTTTTQAKTKTTKAKTAAARTVDMPAKRGPGRPRKATAGESKTSSATTKSRASKIASTPAVAPPMEAPISQQVTPGKRVTFNTIKRLNKLAIGLAIVLAVAAGVLMSNHAEQLTVGYVTENSLASSSGSTVYASAVRAFYDVEIRWLVVGILLLSAYMPFMYLTNLRKPYQTFLENTRMVPYRWLDLAITAGLMMEALALLSGVHDFFILKLVGGFIAVTCFLGFLAERQNTKAVRPARSAFIGSLFTGVMPWILVTAYIVSTHWFGRMAYPWYVYALYAALLVGFKLLAFNQWKQHRSEGKWRDYLWVERNYLLISVLTKTAFALILIAGFWAD